MRSAIHFFSGSLAVYALMAACSAGGKGNVVGSSNGTMTGGAASQGGMMVAGGESATGATSATTGGGAAGTKPRADAGTGGVLGMMMDPVPDADAETKSGTRLKMRYYVGEDGSKQPLLGWHDTMRNEDCYFQKAEDGKLHCIPVVVGAAPTYFSDDACTSSPLTLVAKASGSACASAITPRPEYVYSSESCGTNRQRWTVSATPAAGTIYSKSGANCTELIPAVAALYDFYPMTSPEPAPASAFVAATETVE